MKLVYFNGRGLAETSRLLMALAKQDYEDFRYPLEIIDWSTHNMVKEEFDRDKADGKLTLSLNKVPYLEVDGHVICQSKSIERYLARRFNMMGSNDIEAAHIDSICEVVRDIKDAYQKVRRLDVEERTQGMNVWFNETLPSRFSDLEVILNNDNHSVGNLISLADVVLYSLCVQFFDDKESAYAATSNTPKLRGIVNHISENPLIEQWLERRPTTNF